MPLGEPLVHPQQVTGEQGRLLAALPRLDLKEDVLVVVGVARHQQHVEPLLQLFAAGGKLLRLGRERGILGRELPRGGLVLGGLQPLAVCLDDRGQLTVTAAERPGPVLVTVDGRVGQVLLKLRVLGGKVGKPLEHMLTLLYRNGLAPRHRGPPASCRSVAGLDAEFVRL